MTICLLYYRNANFKIHKRVCILYLIVFDLRLYYFFDIKNRKKSSEKIGINVALLLQVTNYWHLFGIKSWTLVGRLNTKNISGSHIYCVTYCPIIYTSRVVLSPWIFQSEINNHKKSEQLTRITMAGLLSMPKSYKPYIIKLLKSYSYLGKDVGRACLLKLCAEFGLIFCHSTRTYMSLSYLVCSCSNPNACISSWMTVP